MAAAASGAAYAEGTRPAVTFGRSLDIEGTPLRLARAFNPGFTLARPGTRPSGLPLKANWISSGFGMRFHPFGGGAKFHGGLDFAAPTGTAVHATAPGVISFAGWNGNYGLCVVIDHGGGTSTLFGHLSAVTSVPGTRSAWATSSGASVPLADPPVRISITRSAWAADPSTPDRTCKAPFLPVGPIGPHGAGKQRAGITAA